MTNRHNKINNAVNIDDAIKEAVEYFIDTEKMMMMSRYSWDRGVDEEAIDLEDEATREDYEEYVTAYASDRVDDALTELCWSIDEEEGRVSIWRSLTVPADFLDNGIRDRPLGIYWSFNEDAAESHWGNFSDDRLEIVLHAVADINDIDWQTSLELNAHSEEEKELRLKPTAIVHVISATWTAIDPKEPARTVLLGADFAVGDTSNPARLVMAA